MKKYVVLGVVLVLLIVLTLVFFLKKDKSFNVINEIGTEITGADVSEFQELDIENSLENQEYQSIPVSSEESNQNLAEETVTNNNNGVYTLTEVSAHDSSIDCWQVINGTIYDMTDFIKNGFHKPGMDVVIAECGTDSTEIFIKEHQGRHATEAYNGLGDLVVVGELIL